MDVTLTLTGRQHKVLRDHLFPGDDKEAVALLLCGRRAGPRHRLLAHEVFLIPHDRCQRERDRLTWPTEVAVPALEKAAKRGLSVVKVHSHPGGFPRFSKADDEADSKLFPSLFGWVDHEWPHASAVMLPDGRMFGRAFFADGACTDLALISVVGDDLHFWHAAQRAKGVPEFARRHAQVFGERTYELLSNLSIAVVGCSGTGSPVVEQLARLGVGHLVLVDPDRVEDKNLNRIINSTQADVGRLKVDVLAEAVAAMGTGTKVTVVPLNLIHPDAVKAVANCDLVFGCMDGHEGRRTLNRLAAFYSLPYFDVGIRLDADGVGGVDQVCGSVHYLQPDGSSLLSRGVISNAQADAEAMKRTDPATYEDLRRQKYIKGVQEDRPAVISVNMFFASLAINEFLARMHPYRLDDNGEFDWVTISLTQFNINADFREAEPCKAFSRFAGRGDVVPLLDMPALDAEGRP